MTNRIFRLGGSYALTIALGLSAALAARQRDVVATATASVSGVVVTQGDSQPVRRAIVSLSGDELPLSRNAITDDAGRFVLAGIPGGRFKLMARRPGYVSIAYGARRPRREGTALAIGSGQQIADVHLQLARGAIIAGTVRNANAEPVPGLDVSLLRRETGDRWVSAGVTRQTDDRGAYRVFGLESGEYVVAAQPRTADSGDVAGPTDAEVDAVLMSLQQRRTGARGVTQTVPPAPPSRADALVPIFYPSAIIAADATPIVVGPGEERQGVDLTLQMLSPSTVEGTIASVVDRALTPVQVTLTTEAGARQPGSILTTAASADGTFRFTRVVPGRYVLTARAQSQTARQLDFGIMSPSDARARGSQPCLFGTADVAVSGADVRGISIALRPCLRIVGRVIFTGTLAAPEDLTRIHVAAFVARSSASSGFAPILGPAPSVRVDGSFEIDSLVSGTYLITATVPGNVAGAGWSLRSVMVDAQNILDEPLVLSATSPNVTAVVVAFSDRHASLSGHLGAPSQESALECTMIAFTADRVLWVPPFRRVFSARPASDGEFAFQDLPPGDYYLAALTDVAPNEWQDAKFLAALAASSLRLTIGEGEHKVQNLQIAK